MDVGREEGFGLGMESHFVADVGEVGLAGLELTDDVEGFREGVMGKVFLFP